MFTFRNTTSSYHSWREFCIRVIYIVHILVVVEQCIHIVWNKLRVLCSLYVVLPNTMYNHQPCKSDSFNTWVLKLLTVKCLMKWVTCLREMYFLFWQTLALDEIKTHHWCIVGCSAVTGENLLTGVDWLLDDIAARIFTTDWETSFVFLTIEMWQL